jgi:hypothetical protein
MRPVHRPALLAPDIDSAISVDAGSEDVRPDL